MRNTRIQCVQDDCEESDCEDIPIDFTELLREKKKTKRKKSLLKKKLRDMRKKGVLSTIRENKNIQSDHLQGAKSGKTMTNSERKENNNITAHSVPATVTKSNNQDEMSQVQSDQSQTTPSSPTRPYHYKKPSAPKEHLARPSTPQIQGDHPHTTPMPCQSTRKYNVIISKLTNHYPIHTPTHTPYHSKA